MKSITTLVILSLTGFSLILQGCETFKKVTGQDEEQEEEKQEVTYQIKHEVTGSATAVSLDYKNATGGRTEKEHVSLPWFYSLTAHTGNYVFLVVMNEGVSGTVTATIYKDGSVLQTSASTSRYGVVDVDATV